MSNNLYIGNKQKQSVRTSRQFWLVLFCFIVLSYTIPAFFLAVSPRDEMNSIDFGYAAPGLIIGSALQVFAVIWGLRLRNTNRPLAMGLLIGVLMTLVVLPIGSLVALIIIFASLGI